MDCNFEDNYFRSMDGRPLEARNLSFRNAFSFISIRFLIPKISSCKEKDNFASAFLRKNIDHWPIHNRLKYYLESLYLDWDIGINRKILVLMAFLYSLSGLWWKWIYFLYENIKNSVCDFVNIISCRDAKCIKIFKLYFSHNMTYFL